MKAAAADAGLQSASFRGVALLVGCHSEYPVSNLLSLRHLLRRYAKSGNDRLCTKSNQPTCLFNLTANR